MIAKDLMQRLFSWCQGVQHDYSNTCDTLKCGDPNREVHKVAITMFPTPNLIREAADWEADILIVHEPTFYEHLENKAPNDPVIQAKEKILQETGLTIWRFHDHPHVRRPDMICEGELKFLELKGKLGENKYFGVNRFTLDKPMTPRELASHIQQKLKVQHVRIAGTMDKPCQNLSLAFGAPGHHMDELRDPQVDVVIAGETSEWAWAQYAREADQMGFKKALLVLSHIPSERDGMKFLTELIQQKIPEIQAQYFESGEAYAYVDSPK